MALDGAASHGLFAGQIYYREVRRQMDMESDRCRRHFFKGPQDLPHSRGRHIHIRLEAAILQ